MQEAHKKVKLVAVLNGCFDYACAVCNKVYPFYDQALDCALGHRLKRLNTRSQKHGRSWIPRRY